MHERLKNSACASLHLLPALSTLFLGGRAWFLDPGHCKEVDGCRRISLAHPEGCLGCRYQKEVEADRFTECPALWRSSLLTPCAAAHSSTSSRVLSLLCSTAHPEMRSPVTGQYMEPARQAHASWVIHAGTHITPAWAWGDTEQIEGWAHVMQQWHSGLPGILVGRTEGCHSNKRLGCSVPLGHTSGWSNRLGAWIS